MRISDWSSDVCSSDLRHIDDHVAESLGDTFSKPLAAEVGDVAALEIDVVRVGLDNVGDVIVQLHFLAEGSTHIMVERDLHGVEQDIEVQPRSEERRGGTEGGGRCSTGWWL